MGFFSRLATEIYEEVNEEDMFQSRERQLLWRLEDLKCRLEELKKDCLQGICADRRLTKEDLMYAIPGDLHTISEVNKAIWLVKDELGESIGIVYEKDDTELKNHSERVELVAA